MRRPQLNDCVRLIHDVPEMLLSRGDLGVVRSTWFAPAVAYEVEFHPLGVDTDTRVLLRADQMEVEEDRAAAVTTTPAATEGDAIVAAPPAVR